MRGHNKNLLYMYGLQRAGIRPGLGRIKKLLAALKDPHRDFPSIHVAGTNGKGSTSAMLSTVLCEAGYRTGLYTSPHLIDFRERIRVGGGLITKNALNESVLTVKKAAKKAGLEDKLSFFEFTTALAFLHFSRKKIDIAVVEAGMGGRWDATNTITPLVSVITNIGLDHTQYLGDSIPLIAGEKAGIIKKKVPVVTAEEKKGAIAVISGTAEEKGAPLFRINKDFRLEKKNGRLDYLGINTCLGGLRLSLAGEHQEKNAAVAMAATELLRARGLRIPDRAIRAGLADTVWPGRAEVLSRRPLVMLDAAHNPDGAATLRAALKGFKYKRLVLVLGIMADKDIPGMMKALKGAADTVILTHPATERAKEPEELLRMLGSFAGRSLVVRSVKDACRAGLAECSQNDALCVTGSIFTIGEAKQYLRRALPAR